MEKIQAHVHAQVVTISHTLHQVGGAVTAHQNSLSKVYKGFNVLQTGLQEFMLELSLHKNTIRDLQSQEIPAHMLWCFHERLELLESAVTDINVGLVVQGEEENIPPLVAMQSRIKAMNV